MSDIREETINQPMTRRSPLNAAQEDFLCLCSAAPTQPLMLTQCPGPPFPTPLTPAQCTQRAGAHLTPTL